LAVAEGRNLSRAPFTAFVCFARKLSRSNERWLDERFAFGLADMCAVLLGKGLFRRKSIHYFSIAFAPSPAILSRST
jgi:hypothetical protein